MQIDTGFLALIISVISLCSPIVTTLINNIFLSIQRKRDGKIERRKPVELHQREILESALKEIGSLRILGSRENKTEFGSSCLLAYAYVDAQTADTLMELYLASVNSPKDISDEMLEVATKGITDCLHKLHI